MDMDDKDHPIVAAAVVVVEGRVLLIRRRFAKGRLLWQFPAGKVEPGEEIEDAAVRETFEEVGLTVAAVMDLGARTHRETGRMVRYVACVVVEGVAHPADVDEVAEIDWCDSSALRRRVPYPLHLQVQTYLDARLA
jgi:8-oxo-dGTP diphosphatase